MTDTSSTFTAAELKRKLRPMFVEMLSADEFATLSYRLVLVDDGPDGSPIDPSAHVHEFEAWVRWSIRGEEGGSGGLPVDGAAAAVRAVQSDLQDFISESAFGWGQLRGPHDLP